MSVVYYALIVYPVHMGKASSILLMAVLLLASCTVTESMTINNQDSFGSVSEIKAEPFFVSVLEDFAEFLPENGKSIMDSSIEGFAGQLRETAGAEAVSYEKTGENEYTLAFSTNDLTTLLGSFGAADQSFVKIGENSFSFYLDINNYPELKTIVPFLADPNFEVYGPEYNQGMGEADYLEMIYFLLGNDKHNSTRYDNFCGECRADLGEYNLIFLPCHSFSSVIRTFILLCGLAIGKPERI